MLDYQIYYAGIGSRKTPETMCTLMTQVATYLDSQGWTLRSGAAEGADTAFEKGTQNKEIYLPWAGYNQHPSELNPKTYPFSEHEQEFTAHFHPAWNRCSSSARLLHQRNTRIILGCPQLQKPISISKFVVCWTPGGQTTGGTGQALRIAEAYTIPIVNFGDATHPAELEDQLLRLDQIQEKLKT